MPTALYPIHISHYLVCQSVLCHISQKSKLLKPWTVFWKTNDKKSFNVSITWGKSQKSDQSFFSLFRGYAMWVSVYNYNYKYVMTASPLYITCALRCQKGMKCFILLHETSQVSPEPPHVCPAITGWPTSLAVYLSVRNLANLAKNWTGDIPYCAGALLWLTVLTITRSTETEDEKLKYRLSLRLSGKQKEKRFSTGAKNSNVFIAKGTFLSLPSPCANKNSPVIRTPISSANWIVTSAGSSQLFGSVPFSQRGMWCEMKSNKPQEWATSPFMLPSKTRYFGNNEFCHLVIPGLARAYFSLFLRRQLLVGVLSLEAQALIMLYVVLMTSNHRHACNIGTDQILSLYICLSWMQDHMIYSGIRTHLISILHP